MFPKPVRLFVPAFVAILCACGAGVLFSEGRTPSTAGTGSPVTRAPKTATGGPRTADVFAAPGESESPLKGGVRRVARRRFMPDAKDRGWCFVEVKVKAGSLVPQSVNRAEGVIAPIIEEPTDGQPPPASRNVSFKTGTPESFGAFEVPVVAGRYSLVLDLTAENSKNVWGPGAIARGEFVIDTASPREALAEVALEPDPLLVQGEVRLAGGAFQGTCSVWISSPKFRGASPELAVEGDGKFRIYGRRASQGALAEEPLTLVVDRSGYARWSNTVADGAVVVVDLRREGFGDATDADSQRADADALPTEPATDLSFKRRLESGNSRRFVYAHQNAEAEDRALVHRDVADGSGNAPVQEATPAQPLPSGNAPARARRTGVPPLSPEPHPTGQDQPAAPEIAAPASPAALIVFLRGVEVAGVASDERVSARVVVLNPPEAAPRRPTNREENLDVDGSHLIELRFDAPFGSSVKVLPVVEKIGPDGLPEPDDVKTRFLESASASTELHLPLKEGLALEITLKPAVPPSPSPPTEKPVGATGEPAGTDQPQVVN